MHFWAKVWMGTKSKIHFTKVYANSANFQNNALDIKYC